MGVCVCVCVEGEGNMETEDREHSLSHMSKGACTTSHMTSTISNAECSI